MNSTKHPDNQDNSTTNNEDRSFYPRWLYFAPFLGKPPAMTRRQWNIMGLLAIISIFQAYDLTLFHLALKQIQAAFAIPEDQVGKLGAIVGLGALPAFFFTMLADRLGRRRILLLSIVAFTLLTGATAFAPDVETFAALQFLTRMFAVTATLLAYVVITEELDPEVRGWGTGALAALTSMGDGLGLLLFAFIDKLPMGWRALYLVGLIPLLMIAWLRRNIPETMRFENHQKTRKTTSVLRDAFQPLIALIRMYPGRFAAIGSVIFLLGFADSAAGFFTPKYFQEAHGWMPWQYAVLGYCGGFIGIFGSAYAGRLSDRHGRRRVAIFFLAVSPLFTIALYQSFGWLLPPVWIMRVFSGMAGGVVLGTFGNELFPTSYRSTASGGRMILFTLGHALGLWVESILYGLVGSHWTAICIVVLLAFFGPVIIAIFFPETKGRTLEDIAPER